MTIEKGEEWGAPADPTMACAVRRDDADLAGAVAENLSPHTCFSVAEGDVLRTIGLSEQRPAHSQMALPMDLGFVALDDGPKIPFVAHVVARKCLWFGSFVVAMNAAWVASLYLGPKAHPNDGVLDVTHGQLGGRDLLRARRRATSGTHLPHPDLHTKRVRQWEITLAKKTPVHIDGVKNGSYRTLAFSVVPDAFTLIA